MISERRHLKITQKPDKSRIAEAYDEFVHLLTEEFPVLKEPGAKITTEHTEKSQNKQVQIPKEDNNS